MWKWLWRSWSTSILFVIIIKEVYRLGFGKSIAVSAEHGDGIIDLMH